MKRQQLALIFAIISLLFSQSVFAGRFGGGRSSGMQRSQSTSSYSRSNNYAQPQAHNSAPSNNSPINSGGAAAPRQGMGAGTAAVLGAAAGAAGGYMLGKSMSNENAADKTMASGVTAQTATAAATTEAPSKMPWGIIGILAILLILGLMFFRKKTNPSFPQNNSMNNNNQNNNNNFNIPNVGRNNSMFNSMQQKAQNTMNGNNNHNSDSTDRMQDGIENVYFLRQAKGMFLHIQSMNNPDNISEIQKYLTPSLYNDIKADIANNNVIADFPVLNCTLLNSNVENDQLVASVSFNGLVSDNPEQQPQPFMEIWNFIKPDLKINKWLVAGIQQQPEVVK